MAPFVFWIFAGSRFFAFGLVLVLRVTVGAVVILFRLLAMLFLLAAPFLFCAFFAAVAHDDLPILSLRLQRREVRSRRRNDVAWEATSSRGA